MNKVVLADLTWDFELTAGCQYWRSAVGMINHRPEPGHGYWAWAPRARAPISDKNGKHTEFGSAEAAAAYLIKRTGRTAQEIETTLHQERGKDLLRDLRNTLNDLSDHKEVSDDAVELLLAYVRKTDLAVTITTKARP